MTTRRVLLACGAGAALLTIAFAAGRFSAPVKTIEKVKTETQVQYVDRVVEKVVYRKSRDTQAHLVVTTEKKVDGSETVVKVLDTKAHTDANGGSLTASVSTGSAQAKTESSKVVETARPDWRLSAQVGWGRDPVLSPSIFGGEVDRRILGPMWLGVWGHTDGTFGLAASVEF